MVLKELVLIVLTGWKTEEAKSQTLVQEQSYLENVKMCYLLTDASFSWRGSTCILELGCWNFMGACLWRKSATEC